MARQPAVAPAAPLWSPSAVSQVPVLAQLRRQLPAWLAACLGRPGWLVQLRPEPWGLQLAWPERVATDARARSPVVAGPVPLTLAASRQPGSTQQAGLSGQVQSARASRRRNPLPVRRPAQQRRASPETSPHGRSSASPTRKRRIGHAHKNSAPRFAGEPGALKIQAFVRRESVRFSFYENHESLALLSQAESCFSASSFAMP